MHDHFGEGGLKNYLNRQQRRDNIRKSTTVVAALIITWSGNVGRRNRIGTIFIYELILLFVSIRRLPRRLLHPRFGLSSTFNYPALRPFHFMLLLCTFSKPKVVCGKFKYNSESERADSSRHRRLIHEFEVILLMFSKGKSISINWEMEKPRSSSVHSLQRIILVKNARLVLRLKWSVSVSCFRLRFRFGLCRLFALIVWR